MVLLKGYYSPTLLLEELSVFEAYFEPFVLGKFSPQPSGFSQFLADFEGNGFTGFMRFLAR